MFYQKKVLLVVCCLVLLTLSACTNNYTPADDDISVEPAEAESIDKFITSPEDYEYELNEDGTIIITKYTGADKKICIPSEIDGHPVFAIGNIFKEHGAFHDNTTITEVIIPEGIEELHDNAFYCCTSLTTVYIPSSIVAMRNCAFAGCTSLQSIYFAGDPPATANYVFDTIGDATVYFPEGNNNWKEIWLGIPTKEWTGTVIV